MSVKVVCGAAAVLIAVGQVSHMPREQRLTLWMQAGRWLGLDAAPASATAGPSLAPPRLVDPVVARVETFEPDRFGQFNADVESEGQRFPVLIDTGASSVSLSFETADRLGLRPLPSDFRHMVTTANGRTAYAAVELRELRLGSIVVRDVTALVAPRGALSRSLLGMSFLKRLSNFRIDGGRLVLQG